MYGIANPHLQETLLQKTKLPILLLSRKHPLFTVQDALTPQTFMSGLGLIWGLEHVAQSHYLPL